MVSRHSGHSAAGPAQFHSLGRCTRTFRISSSGVLGAVGDNLGGGLTRARAVILGVEWKTSVFERIVYETSYLQRQRKMQFRKVSLLQ